jgi:hypothetical protein
MAPSKQINKSKFRLPLRVSRCAAVTLCFTLSACSGGSERRLPLENNGGKPAHDHAGLLIARVQVPGFLAPITGLLTTKNGCVVIDNGRTDYALVWPNGTEFTDDRRAIAVPQGDGTRRSYALGHTYTLVGGGISHVDGGSASFEPPGNPACKGQGWIVATPSQAGDGQ